MTSANNLSKRSLILKIEEMFPDTIKERKVIKGINHTMFRGLEWNPETVYPTEPENFALTQKPKIKTKKMELNF